MARGPRVNQGVCAPTALGPPVGTSWHLVHGGDAYFSVSTKTMSLKTMSGCPVPCSRDPQMGL